MCCGYCYDTFSTRCCCVGLPLVQVCLVLWWNCLLIGEGCYCQRLWDEGPMLIFPVVFNTAVSTNSHVIASTQICFLATLLCMSFTNGIMCCSSVVIQCGYYKHEVIARFRCYVAKRTPLSQLILHNLFGYKNSCFY